MSRPSPFVFCRDRNLVIWLVAVALMAAAFWTAWHAGSESTSELRPAVPSTVVQRPMATLPAQG
jgi:type II secretory pathway component PulM